MQSDGLCCEQDMVVGTLLALDYVEDLSYLKNINLLARNRTDLRRLKFLCAKHHVNVVVTKGQFPFVIGKLSNVTLAKLERLVIEDMLGV